MTKHLATRAVATLLLFSCANGACRSLQAQNLRIGDGKATVLPFPVYLEVATSSDPLGILPLFETELRRVGYRIVSSGEREQLVARGRTLRTIATALPASGARKGGVKEVTRSAGLKWRRGGKAAAEELVDLGVWRRRGRKFKPVAGASLDRLDLTAPHSTCRLNFTYDDRSSIACARTIARIEGSFEDLSGGKRVALVPFAFEQGMLSNDCPPAVLETIANGLRPTEAAGGRTSFSFSPTGASFGDARSIGVSSPTGKPCSPKATKKFSTAFERSCLPNKPGASSRQVDAALSDLPRAQRGEALFAPTPPSLSGMPVETVVISRWMCTDGTTSVVVRALDAEAGTVVWEARASALATSELLTRIRKELNIR
jgi:hypothetical protein